MSNPFLKKYKRCSSPFEGGVMPPKPRDAEHARSLIRDADQQTDIHFKKMKDAVCDMLDSYDESCRRFVDREFAACERCAKEFSEAYRSLLEEFDNLAFNNMQRAKAKEFLDAIEPFDPFDKAAEHGDENGGKERLVQGSIWG